MEFLKEFGNLVHEKREALDYSQEKLAEKVDIDLPIQIRKIRRNDIKQVNTIFFTNFTSFSQDMGRSGVFC